MQRDPRQAPPNVGIPSDSRVQQVQPQSEFTASGEQPVATRPIGRAPQIRPIADRHAQQEHTQPHLQQPAQKPPVEAAPDPAPEPEKKEKKPSAFVAFVKKWLKVIAVVAVAGGAYSANAAWEARQPYEWSGSVEIKTIAVGSRVGGRVADIRVHEGQQVEQGDILVMLDPIEFEAKRDIAQADLEAAEAALDKLVKGARPEEIAQAAARLAMSKSTLARQGSVSAQQFAEARAAQALFQSGAISAAELHAKLSAASAAGGGAGEAAASIKEAEASLKLLAGGARPEDIRVAKENVAVAKAKLAVVLGQASEMNIRAPRRARVERILVRPGDLLRPDAPAASLLEAGQLYVKIFVPETRLGTIRIGQEVPIAVDSYPKRRFRGRVDYINEQGEYTPRRLVTTEDRASEVFAARVTLLEGENELRSGMAAFIQIPK